MGGFMPDFVLLKHDQIWTNTALGIIKMEAQMSIPTDLTILLGAIADYRPWQNRQGMPTCYTWSDYNYDDGGVQCILSGRMVENIEPNYQAIATRPVLLLSKADHIDLTPKGSDLHNNDIIEYGEYPQTIAGRETKRELEKLFDSGKLASTGKTYTLGSAKNTSSGMLKKLLGMFKSEKYIKQYPEYEYRGKRYIRVLGQPHNEGHSFPSTCVDQAKTGVPYWIRVEPIEWLRDNKTGILVARRALFAGIPFDTEKTYNGDFSKTFMKHYLDTYFAKDIETPEMKKEREKQEMMTGLKEKLAEISDLEKVKRTIKKPARTPERTEQLARITRVRKAKALLSAAAQKAQKESDRETLQEIVEMAKPYAARAAAIRNKFNLKRAERRARKNKGQRG